MQTPFPTQPPKKNIKETRPTKYLGYFSEDYYGDLDLKSIRKSELLAGLASSGSSRPGNAGAAKKSTRPAPASRNAPEPSN